MAVRRSLRGFKFQRKPFGRHHKKKKKNAPRSRGGRARPPNAGPDSMLRGAHNREKPTGFARGGFKAGGAGAKFFGHPTPKVGKKPHPPPCKNQVTPGHKKKKKTGFGDCFPGTGKGGNWHHADSGFGGPSMQFGLGAGRRPRFGFSKTWGLTKKQQKN